MDGQSYFSASYREARARFLAACNSAGAAVESLPHRGLGPEGEALAIDCAWLGPADPEALLVSVSATHGAEGHCGSAVQLGWLESGLHRQRPAGVAQVLVHALNPYGFAWTRRTNEENVDLNRNFIDFAAPLPQNPGYDALAELLCPLVAEVDSLAASQEVLEAMDGDEGAFMAVLLGQYRHPKGLFYGGQSKAWSNHALSNYLQRRLRNVSRLALIDLHTGYGPYGYGDPMSCHRFGDAADARVRAWYGAETSTAGDGTREFPHNFGDLSNIMTQVAPRAAQASITLEFGTRPEWEVFRALRRENWLYHHGTIDSAEGRLIKAELRDAFYPEEDLWKGKVWDRAAEIHLRALSGLAQS